MKIKKYFEFTTEGLKDLSNSMIVSGELKRLNTDNWSSSEISDIEAMKGTILGEREAQLSTGHKIIKSKDKFELKIGDKTHVIRRTPYTTSPSDWEIFVKLLNQHLSDSQTTLR